jgi:hypothetical protein
MLPTTPPKLGYSRLLSIPIAILKVPYYIAT